MFLIHSLEIVAMLSCVLCIVSIVREGERVRERERGGREEAASDCRSQCSLAATTVHPSHSWILVARG
jgi:hypothetical protein